jgi:TonB family protein
MKINKEKIIGWIGSVLFCGLLLLLLYFCFLYTRINTKEEGTIVNFGTVDWAAGTFEPQPDEEEQTSPAEQIPVNKPAPVKASPVITQTAEQTVALNAANKQKQEQQAEQKRRAEEQRKKEAEEQRKRDAINQQMAGAFGSGSTPQGNEGTASSGTGNQGSLQGNAATGAYSGTGSYGGFDLSGRSLRSGGLPRPTYSVQEEGRIVINITVDPQGNVIAAEIGRGTNITHSAMRTSALEAARKAKFSAITGNNNQSGTITYNYKLN